MTDIPSIQKKVEDLASLVDQRNELEGLMSENTKDIADRIAENEEEIKRLQGLNDVLRVEMEEREPDVYKDLTDARKRVSDLMAEIKADCHSLDINELRDGLKLHSEDKTLKVTVNKVTTITNYNPDIIKEVPELMEMSVDGDPVVVPSINEAVMERLVSKGKISEEVASKYRTEGKKSNPGVRFEEIES